MKNEIPVITGRDFILGRVGVTIGTSILGLTWPLSPPPLCVKTADKVYGLGTSRMEEIKIKHFGWKQDLLLEV